MEVHDPQSAGSRVLGTSARSALLWGGGATLLRDVAQFGVMLILVRILTPADYGTAALIQAIFGVLAVFSCVTFSAHVLQGRNPENIDWQVHFTAAVIFNLALVTVVLVIAFGLSFTKFHEAALPFGALAVVFLIEIPGALRHRMLEANHQWRRFRVLLVIGTFLGLSAGLAVALMGGGVWALIVQMPMTGLPAAIDLFVGARFRPSWRWSWASYRDTVRFGIDRIGSGLIVRGRVFNEQVLLSSLYDLATLGIFARATGLAALIAGRIGAVTMMSLYPVVTRAERGSARFQRLAGLVLRGVCWTTVPAAAFLGLAADEIVQLVYGAQWANVVSLMPLASAGIALGGISTVLSSLLLANDESRAALSIDLIAAVSGIALALVLVPFGVAAYLAGLILHALGITGLAIVILMRCDAIDRRGALVAFGPPFVAGLVSVAMVVGCRYLSESPDLIEGRLGIEAVIFGVTYVSTLRIAFATALAELLSVAPGGQHVARVLRCGA